MKKKQKGGNQNIFIIGENHNHPMRTVAHMNTILKNINSQEKIAIVTELGMCRNYADLDTRILQCEEEPEQLNILSSVINLMATLCLYHIPENEQLFHILQPKMTERGYIPNIGSVKTESGRKEALQILFNHITTLLRECSPANLLSSYLQLITQFLKDCSDTTSSISLGNDLRNRWFVGKAKDLSKNYQRIIIIVGFGHVQSVIHHLGNGISVNQVFM